MKVVRALLAVVAVFAFWFSVRLCVYSRDEPIQTAPTRPQLPQPAPPAPIPRFWTRLAYWGGQSKQQTETFTISSREWRIGWSTSPEEREDMSFQVHVYREDGTLVGLAADITGKDTGSTLMQGQGDYYLVINSSQMYFVTVEVR